MNTRIPALAILLCLVLAGAAPARARADLWVDDDASSDGDGSPASPFRTIADAVLAATDGTIIHVLRGTYHEYVPVRDVALSFVGEGCHRTTIEAPAALPAIELFEGATVSVTGIEFSVGTDAIGIRATGPALGGLDVSDSCFDSAGLRTTGVRYLVPAPGRIEGSSFEGLQRGVAVRAWRPGTRLTLIDDEFVDVYHGVNLNEGGGVEALDVAVSRSTFYECHHAIDARASGRARIDRNELVGGYSGIRVSRGRHVVVNNVLVGFRRDDLRDGSGIRVSSAEAFVAHNTVVDSWVGIACSGSDASTLIANAVLRSRTDTPYSTERGIQLVPGVATGLQSNAAWGYRTPGDNIGWVSTAVDLGGNYDDRRFALTSEWEPARHGSILVNRAVPSSSVYLRYDFDGTRRSRSPEIGAQEYVVFGR